MTISLNPLLTAAVSFKRQNPSSPWARPKPSDKPPTSPTGIYPGGQPVDPPSTPTGTYPGGQPVDPPTSPTYG